MPTPPYRAVVVHPDYADDLRGAGQPRDANGTPRCGLCNLPADFRLSEPTVYLCARHTEEVQL